MVRLPRSLSGAEVVRRRRFNERMLESVPDGAGLSVREYLDLL